VGIDGGYVRVAHKEGFFEVIAGRSVVAFRRKAGLLLDLQLIRAHSAAAGKLAAGMSEFEIYIRNNREFNQSGGEPSLRQKATDAMDAARGSSAAANPPESSEQRIGGRVPAVVSQFRAEAKAA
jgi:hypothetical protein